MTKENEATRLNKHIALIMGISRREADILIEQGKVKINDAVASLGSRVYSDDTITVNGTLLQSHTDFRYIMLNKPAGYLSSRRSQGAIPTLYSLLPKEFHNLKPVGRLDKNSSGLILLTNDGDFAYHMTHPKFHKTKIYKIRLNKDLEPLHQQLISDFGIQLEDGRSQLHLERLSDANRKEWQVTMTEGRNRQIRRTFTALGYTVTKLHRTQFGIYFLANLQNGKYRIIKSNLEKNEAPTGS